MPQASYNREMLALARESRGYSQSELARKTGLAQSQVSRYENGETNPTEDSIHSICRALNFPEDFFRQTDQVFGFGPSFLFHRKRKTMSASAIRQLRAEVNIARMRIDRLLRGLEYESVNKFPSYQVHEDGSPEEIAVMVRAAWQLPGGPIRNLTQAIESAGAVVLLYPFVSEKVDGLSFCVPPTPPLFFLCDRSPGDRLRWTLAHELGHIVMHNRITPDIEEEANQFASEFLMPSCEIKDELLNLTLPIAAALKLRWHVSIQALVRRAKDLGVISAGRYKSLCVQISRAGMRKMEPNPIDVEEPTNLASILRVHYEEHGYGPEQLGRLTLMDKDEFQRVYDPKMTGLRIAR